MIQINEIKLKCHSPPRYTTMTYSALKASTSCWPDPGSAPCISRCAVTSGGVARTRKSGSPWSSMQREWWRLARRKLSDPSSYMISPIRARTVMALSWRCGAVQYSSLLRMEWSQGVSRADLSQIWLIHVWVRKQFYQITRRKATWRLHMHKVFKTIWFVPLLSVQDTLL